MDLDALLRRRPQIALVDEFAHANVPGARHAHRYQDVEELLAAGIDVYTTLNIQHVESLNDVVAQITGVRVRHTVPDRLLEQAEIQLVDIPVEELLDRLRDGKVYLPHQAERALRKFFRPGNINALRELALRYAARRVEGQLKHYMRVHRIPGPWPVSERVMACVSPSPFSAQVIRAAKRMADGLKADLLAVHVENPDAYEGDEAARDQLARNLRLAEELGAEVITVTAADPAEALVEVARGRNVTHIVVGRPFHPRGWEIWRGSLPEKVMRIASGMNVHVIPGKVTEVGRRRRAARRGYRGYPAKAYVELVAAVALVTLLGWMVGPALDLSNVALLFILPVLFVAARWGRELSIVASVIGLAAFDFFFVSPVLSFAVTDLRHLFSLLVFLMVAITAGSMATRLKAQAESARRREAKTAALYALSRRMVAEAELEGMLKTVSTVVAEAVEGETVILMPDPSGKVVLRAGHPLPPGDWFDENERSVAAWVFARGELAGKGTDTLAGAEGVYLPLKTGDRRLGVLGVRLAHPERHLSSEQRRLLEAFCDLAALGMLRLELAGEAERARCLAESERLQSALLNCISHDLRTPLASIMGAVTGLLEGGETYQPETRQSLLQTIREAAGRLNRLVSNLLDMARLESGTIDLRREWCDVEDIVGVALQELDEALTGRPVRVDIPPDLPLIKADFSLMVQVVVNLLDNALKYSPPGSEIALWATAKEGEVRLAVADRGSGISEGERERIFDKFYRSPSSQHVGGTGLGLPICKGIVEAHGGKIWWEPRPGGGSIFTFSLPPVEPQPAAVPTERAGATDGG
jgi:two-component system sensor histidine kinase KdpD